MHVHALQRQPASQRRSARAYIQPFSAMGKTKISILNVCELMRLFVRNPLALLPNIWILVNVPARIVPAVTIQTAATIVRMCGENFATFLPAGWAVVGYFESDQTKATMCRWWRDCNYHNWWNLKMNNKTPRTMLCRQPALPPPPANANAKAGVRQSGSSTIN